MAIRAAKGRRLSVNLSAKLGARLEEYLSSSGVPLSDVVRTAIDDYLQKRGA